MVFYVQDERYVVVPWMAKSDDVQDERYVVVPWMAKSDDVQDGLSQAPAFQGIRTSRTSTVCHGHMAALRHPCLRGISASMHVDVKE